MLLRRFTGLQVYRFVHVHAVETNDGFKIELSIHVVNHSHDHHDNADDHQHEVDHLTADWDHVYSLTTELPPFALHLTPVETQ